MNTKKSIALSRSKIDLFVRCQRCFYLDRKFGISQPSMPPFSLNNTVDELFKREFDTYRYRGIAHPLMSEYHIDAVPFAHKDLDVWRNAFKGVRYYDGINNIEVYGGVDDVWVNPDGELHIVDYKATSKDTQPTLSKSWQSGYKRQVEIYQFLFEKNGFTISPRAYFVYTNADRGRDEFDNTLRFKTIILPYDGNREWIEKTLKEIRTCLDSDVIPPIGQDWKGDICEHCSYRESAGRAFRDHVVRMRG